MLRIGIIGSGFGQYGLFPAFHKLPGCKVVSLCGKARPQLLAYCKSIGFENLYTDWKKMLAKEDLDALVIAVTPGAQYDIARTALRQGLHVFAEKPLAVNVKQARELVKLATNKKLTHGLDFIFPEIAEWQAVKMLIDTSTLGKLNHLSVRWNFLSYNLRHDEHSWKTNAKQGGGALAFFFSHGLHYLEHFAGPITSSSSQLLYRQDFPEGEVGANLQLKFVNGITGDAHINANSAGLQEHVLTFFCEQGTIVLKNENDVVSSFSVEIFTQGKRRKLKVKKDLGKPGEDERTKIVRKLAKRFVQSANAGKTMSPSFVDGLRVQQLLAKLRK